MPLLEMRKYYAPGWPGAGDPSVAKAAKPRTGAVEMPPTYFLIKYTVYHIIFTHADI